MVNDGPRGINLTYNQLNLPASFSGTVSGTYTYDAEGRKLRSVLGGVVREYIDGIHYKAGTLEFVATAEGRAENSGGTFTYQYNLTDHLGNVRVSFDNNNRVARVIQEDEYYAFGLNRQRFSYSSENKYLYNGKELQEGLGYFDYGARFYDPVIGRWGTVDPLAEQMRRWSPYNYAFDNPIRFIDPDGQRPRPIRRANHANSRANHQRTSFVTTASYTRSMNNYRKTELIEQVSPYNNYLPLYASPGPESLSPQITNNNKAGRALSLSVEGGEVVVKYIEMFSTNGKIGGVQSSGKGYSVSFKDPEAQKELDMLQRDYNNIVNQEIAKIPKPDIDFESITSQEGFDAASNQLKAYHDRVTFTKAKFGPSPIQQVIDLLLKNQNKFIKKEETQRMPSISPGMP